MYRMRKTTINALLFRRNAVQLKKNSKGVFDNAFY